jgi:hypothetical protein
MRPVACLALALALAAMPACKRSPEPGGPAQERAMQQGSDLVKVSEAGLVVASDGGTVALGLGSGVPADFPRAVSPYAGAKITASSRNVDPHGSPTWTLLLETPDDVDRVATFYLTTLGPAATDVSVGTSRMMGWTSLAYEVSLMAAPGTGAQTLVTLGVTGHATDAAAPR